MRLARHPPAGSPVPHPPNTSSRAPRVRRAEKGGAHAVRDFIAYAGVRWPCSGVGGGMDFDLPESHVLLQSVVREFARERIAPRIIDYLERDAFPLELVRGLA